MPHFLIGVGMLAPLSLTQKKRVHRINPFKYASTPLNRRHGPVGYSKYQHYRPWLRDEFCFRCVYCLKREQWCSHDTDYELDHEVARSIAPKLTRKYSNLVYSCANCNRRKGAKSLLSPCAEAYGACMEVLNDGRIVHHNESGERLIDELALDGVKITEWRAKMIASIAAHQKDSWELFLLWMGFPKDIPDLANISPLPKGNLRPEGIANSWYYSKRPEYYE